MGEINSEDMFQQLVHRHLNAGASGEAGSASDLHAADTVPELAQERPEVQLPPSSSRHAEPDDQEGFDDSVNPGYGAPIPPPSSARDITATPQPDHGGPVQYASAPVQQPATFPGEDHPTQSLPPYTGPVAAHNGPLPPVGQPGYPSQPGSTSAPGAVPVMPGYAGPPAPPQYPHTQQYPPQPGPGPAQQQPAAMTLDQLRQLAVTNPAEFQRLFGGVLPAPVPAEEPAAPAPTPPKARVSDRADVAKTGWRGWVARHLGIAMTKSARESEQDLLDLATANMSVRLSEPIVLGVTSFKGGCGKTHISVALGKLLAEVRGESVLAMDVDLHGMLQSVAMSSADIQQSVGTMTTLCARLLAYPDQVNIADYLHHAGGGFNVIPGNTFGAEAALSPEGFIEAIELAKRHFSVIIVDMSQVQHSALYATVLQQLTGLVMVTLPDEANTNFLAGTRSLLSARTGVGAEHLITQRVTVINNLFPPLRRHDTNAAAERLKLHETADAATANPRGSDIAEVPFDKQIRECDVLRLDEIGRHTRTALTLLGGALFDAVLDLNERT